MIIDIRCRPNIEGAGTYFSPKTAGQRGHAGAAAVKGEPTLEEFFKDIKDAGITTAIAASGNNPGCRVGRRVINDRDTPNEVLAELQKNYPGKIVGVAGIDPGNVYHNAIEELERCVKKLGLKIVFFEPVRSPGCPFNDRRLYPIYEKCVELDVPMIFQTSGLLGGTYMDYSHPRHIEQVAEDFPDLNIICGHGCYPWVREMIVLSARRHNIWTSPDGNLLRLGTDEWVQSVNENYFGFADKFLFGSSYPLRPIKPYVDAFFKLPWKKEYLDRILYKNAITALKLDRDPAIKKMYKL